MAAALPKKMAFFCCCGGSERAASAIYPVVESGPGRVVTVTITKGAKFQMPARAGSRQGARLVELTQETEE